MKEKLSPKNLLRNHHRVHYNKENKLSRILMTPLARSCHMMPSHLLGKWTFKDFVHHQLNHSQATMRTSLINLMRVLSPPHIYHHRLVEYQPEKNNLTLKTSPFCMFHALQLGFGIVLNLAIVRVPFGSLLFFL